MNNSLPLLILVIGCEHDPTKVESNPLDNSAVLTDMDGDGYLSDEDCDDNSPISNPGAEEICDGLDNDCDGEVDNGVLLTFYEDSDGDGFGDENNTINGCSVREGYVINGNDCNDQNADVYPSASEQCDGLDNDCDEEVDEDLSERWYFDSDGDGFGDPNHWNDSCLAEEGYITNDQDCDDYDANIHPDAEELCDGLDNNCDGNIDENLLQSFYIDSDGDGFGDDFSTTDACQEEPGLSSLGGDCDDIDPEVHPEADEYCDGWDNNCDGVVDENSSTDASIWYVDSDSDGFGDLNNTTIECSQPTGYSSDNTDCNDTDDSIFPSASELCDGQINDCNTATLDLSELDDDGDGYVECTIDPAGWDGTSISGGDDCNDYDATISPSATEIVGDEIDSNCDGEEICVLDNDDDGHGNADGLTIISVDVDCDDTQESDSSSTDDCDDGNALYNPTVGCIGLDCNSILSSGWSSGDGVYSIDSDGTGGDLPYDVYCDMTTDGGGWTVISKVSANDQADHWNYNDSIYYDDSTLGDATTLGATDAKSPAYSAVTGTQIMIADINSSAMVVHTYAANSQSWGDYLASIWNNCGYTISNSADILQDDGRDGVLGNQLFFRHYDNYVPDCSSEERAMLSEYVSNVGWVEVGIGLTQGNGNYLDAQTFTAGAVNYTYNTSAQLDDYIFYVR